MRLIGVYIRKSVPAVTKLLAEDWYPFGKYPKPKQGKGVVLKKIDDVKAGIYNDGTLPKITVNCIVGKNGAGKSTLLDIVYRIINNFTYTLLGSEHRDNQHGRKLEFAKGVFADLYYELNGEQYCISCKEEKLNYFRCEASTLKLLNILFEGIENPKIVLTNFFYTISNNYSIYSFNETVSPVRHTNHNEGFGYLQGLFHKNDGYFTPIVVTPFREGGSIDVEKENTLARQRIVALSLLSYSQHTTFIDAYEPVKLTYELNAQYMEQVSDGYFSYMDRRYRGLHSSLVAESFTQAWEKVLVDQYGDIWDGENMDEYNVAMFYLGYKSFKICMTYDDYWKEFEVDELLKQCDGEKSENQKDSFERFLNYIREKVPTLCVRVIRKINEEINKQGGSHITLKIETTLYYLHAIINNQPLLWIDSDGVSIDKLVGNKALETYNEAVQLLPPPFFNYDMTFTFKGNKAIDSSWNDMHELNEFTFEEMSSGERQMLNMLSYVMYHIKNIQSVKDDEKRVKYHHICLVFDEAELYLHPDYQRRFLSMFLEGLKWCHIDTSVIKSMQIIIVTHSPFVLSDMLNENILYLHKGEVFTNSSEETFGANLYQLMNKSFFFNENAMGKVASRQMTKWIQTVNDGGAIGSEELSLIGDTMVKNYLLRKMSEKEQESCTE